MNLLATAPRVMKDPFIKPSATKDPFINPSVTKGSFINGQPPHRHDGVVR